MHVAADDIIDVGNDHASGEQIAHGVHVAAQEVLAAEVVVIDRRIGAQIQHEHIGEQLGQGIEQLAVLFLEGRALVVLAIVRDGHQEEVGIGRDFAIALKDARVIADEAALVVMPVGGIDILDRAEIGVIAHGLGNIVHAQRHDVGLAGQIVVPQSALVGEGIQIPARVHAAAGEIVHLAAGDARHILTPGIIVHIVIGLLALAAGALKLAGGEGIADAGDRTENADVAAVGQQSVQRLLIRIENGQNHIKSSFHVCFHNC